MAEPPNHFSHGSRPSEVAYPFINELMYSSGPPQVVTVAKARVDTQKRARSIFSNYKLLNGILLRHEFTIRQRWSKKNRQQRTDILLKAWPAMPRNHRPDCEIFRRKRRKKETRTSFGSERRCYLCPYLNQEDLLRAQPLMLLLNARGRHIPSKFAAADFESMRLGLRCEAIPLIWLPGYTMVLHRAKTEDEYGKLLRWDDHPRAQSLFMNRLQFAPCEGFIILEAQEKLMQFLVDCCREILHDFDLDNLTSDKYPVQPEPLFKSEYELRGFESMALIAAEAPYRVPPHFDLRRVESLLAAKTRTIEDHVWALREDPDYCRQYLLDEREYQPNEQNNRYSYDSRRTSESELPSPDAHFISNVLFDAYFELDVFSKIHEQVQELAVLQKKYESVISPTKALPEEFLLAFSKFHLFLLRAVKGNMTQLSLAVVGSPQLRKLYNRPDNGTLPVRKRIKLSKAERECTFLLETLWENDWDLACMGFSTVLDELERFLLNDPTASELISKKVASIVDNLSILSQCHYQIRMYQPWARNFDQAAQQARPGLEAAFDVKAMTWIQAVTAFSPENMSKVVPLAEPLLESFVYPFHKRRTKANVEELRRAEQNLDKFWAEVDDLTHSAYGDTRPALALQKLLSQPNLLQRTPEWTGQPTTTYTVEKPLSPLFYELWGCQTPEEAIDQAKAEPVEAMAETNEVVNQQPSESVESENKEEETTTRPSFKVDNRTLKVFRTLFFNPVITPTPVEIPWNEFLHAMKSAGLSALKLYGPVWQFSLAGIDGEVSVQFWEPRRGSKIPFMDARRYGRTLTRAYGWTESTFVRNK